eukprot:gene19206-25824_t
MSGRGEKGGGAEQAARFKQYDYRANSSLVLTSDTRTRDYQHEPSGEPETLWGKMKGKMGDRVQYQKPEGAEKRKDKAAKKKRDAQQVDDDLGPSKRRTADAGLLGADMAGVYRPKTKETRAAYEGLLSVIHEQFGEQPQDVLRGAADEVISVLKNDNMRDPERQKGCEELLGPLPSEKFAHLIALGKLITDWTGDEAPPALPADDLLNSEIGVAVEEESKEANYTNQYTKQSIKHYGKLGVVVDSDGKYGYNDVPDGREAVNMGGDLHTNMDVDAGEEGAGSGIRVQEIDAYWLQRRIARAFGPEIDADRSQTLSEDVFTTLAGDADQSAVENELVLSLGFEQFELIKELIHNRLSIVWCTKLSRAEDDSERGRIEAEMAATDSTSKILEQLRATRTSARDRQTAMERTIREEARRLRGTGEAADGEGGASEPTTKASAAGTAATAQRHTVDLESLAFQQGSHYRSNKNVGLPEGSFRCV